MKQFLRDITTPRAALVLLALLAWTQGLHYLILAPLYDWPGPWPWIALTLSLVGGIGGGLLAGKLSVPWCLREATVTRYCSCGLRLDVTAKPASAADTWAAEFETQHYALGHQVTTTRPQWTEDSL